MTTINIGNVIITARELPRGRDVQLVFSENSIAFEDAVKPDSIAFHTATVPRFLWNAVLLMAEQQVAITKSLEKRFAIDMSSPSEPFATLDMICGTIANADMTARVRVRPTARQRGDER